MNPNAAARLRSSTPSLGTWLSIGSPVIAELAAECSFDWLLFDLEHGCGAEDALLGNLQAIRRSNAAAIVRVGAPRPELILKVLDWGSDGIMIPHVSNKAEAEHAVRAAHYPPMGQRGFSRSARAYAYGLRPPATDRDSPSPLLMMQIETLEGVKNVREIAQVNGVDALFVGPSDLKFDITRSPDIAADYSDCLRAVAGAAAETGKPWGLLIRNEDEIPSLRELGATVLAIDSDLGILRRRYVELTSRFRNDR